MRYVGVDACPEGWIAVAYDGEGYRRAEAFEGLVDVWGAFGDLAAMLVDVPFGLREDSAEARPCDRAARQRLGSPRSSSVFPTPVRAVLEADSYVEARSIQEERTGSSLGAPTWGIVDRLREADRFAREHPKAMDRVHEAHPEVCFWALDGEQATRYSKTSQPAAAVWERVSILETVDADALAHLRDAGTGLHAGAGMDDVLDAFALAVSASPLTDELAFLPPRGEDGPARDPEGLAMEITYARPG